MDRLPDEFSSKRDLMDRLLEELSSDGRQLAEAVIHRDADVSSRDEFDICRNQLVNHSIDTGAPPNQPRNSSSSDDPFGLHRQERSKDGAIGQHRAGGVAMEFERRVSSKDGRNDKVLYRLSPIKLGRVRQLPAAAREGVPGLVGWMQVLLNA